MNTSISRVLLYGMVIVLGDWGLGVACHSFVDLLCYQGALMLLKLSFETHFPKYDKVVPKW